MLYHGNDRRTEASREAAARVLALCDTGVVLGLGGGPRRVHPRIVNLNIAGHDNVDIVGDAHLLPLAAATVDGVHCEAVFVAQYAPGWLNWPARAAWHIVANLLLRPLDRFLSSRPDAYLVASTHVLLAKPA